MANTLTVTSDAFEILGSLRAQRYLPSQVRAWLMITDFETNQVIGGLDRVPITHMTLRFPRGGIATGDFILAVGYEAVSRKLAQIHQAAVGLTTRFRVQAFVELVGQESIRRAWPKGRYYGAYRVWDGRSLGPGYSRSRDSTAITITSAHWLSDLDSGTVASDSIVKNSADNLLAAYGVDTGGGPSSPSTAYSLLQNADIQIPGDFWAELVWPILRSLMTTTEDATGKLQAGQNWWNTVLDATQSCRLPNDTGTVPPQLGNQRAVKMIEQRFVPAGQTRTLIGGNLQFDVDVMGPEMSLFVAQILAGRLGASTCLEKAKTVASQFLYELLYNVEDATFGPYCPVLHSSRIWRSIYPHEYLFIRGQGYTPRRVQGVGLVGSNFYRETGDPVAMQGRLVGAFRQNTDGQFLLQPAPPWLYYRTPPAFTNLATSQPRTATQKGANGGPVNAVQVQQDAEAFTEQQMQLGCNLARRVWYEEVYRNRMAEITGRLRFDICPGSQVRLVVNGPQLPQAGAGSGRLRYLYGSVENVTIMIDAADPKAHTSFTLSHLRDENEKDLANTEHPVFPKQAWYGSPLVKLDDSDVKPEST